MPARIKQVHAREVLDSRGNPTVEVDVTLDDGSIGRALVPSGASTGKAEALELRDGDPQRYHSRGVLGAVAHVNKEIRETVCGLDASCQARLDATLKSLDGTENKSRLGANALLGVSLAAARAVAASAGLPLYRYLGGMAAAELPLPMINILSGGMHGGGNIDFQDYQAIPLRAHTYSESLHDVSLFYRTMRDVLKSRGVYRPGVADEGGYAPALKNNEQGFELMVEAMERAGFAPGKDMAIAVDVAASHFCANGRYVMAAEGADSDAEGMAARLCNWCSR
ncbi:MAG: phosphopyruvate hydratase, partial [Terriglobia bacterium]